MTVPAFLRVIGALRWRIKRRGDDGGRKGICSEENDGKESVGDGQRIFRQRRRFG